MCFPLLKNKSFKDSEFGIALKRVNDTNCHVGVYWSVKESTTLFHFVATGRILSEDSSDKDDYRFEQLKSFNPVYIPTLITLAPKIAKNNLNLLVKAVKYDGYKFDLKSGIYLAPTKDNQLNCAAFTLALLNTFNIELLNWKTWPEVEISKTQMVSWLKHHNLDSSVAESLRKKNREIRGKHVGAAALSDSLPVSHSDIQELVSALDKVLV